MSDEIQDRMAARFDDEDGQSDKNDNSEQKENPNMKAQSVDSSGDKSDKNEQNVWDVGNVKKDWRAIQAYLPDELYEQWDDEFDRIRYVSEEDWQKDRDFKPLVFYVALQQLTDLDGEEIDALRKEMQEEIQ